MPSNPHPPNIREFLIRAMMPEWVRENDYPPDSMQARSERMMREWDGRIVDNLLSALTEHGYRIVGPQE